MNYETGSHPTHLQHELGGLAADDEAIGIVMLQRSGHGGTFALQNNCRGGPALAKSLKVLERRFCYRQPCPVSSTLFLSCILDCA